MRMPQSSRIPSGSLTPTNAGFLRLDSPQPPGASPKSAARSATDPVGCWWHRGRRGRRRARGKDLVHPSTTDRDNAQRLPLHLHASPDVQGGVMPELPSQPNLDHLRHQARRLLREAQAGDPGALERMGAWSTRLTLAAAQLAVAREYGWGSWDALRHYVEALASIAERRQSPPTMDHAPSSGLPSGVWRGEGDVVLRGGKLAAAAAAAVGRSTARGPPPFDPSRSRLRRRVRMPALGPRRTGARRTRLRPAAGDPAEASAPWHRPRHEVLAQALLGSAR